MKIKYFGTEDDIGLTLTASLFNNEGYPLYQGFTMQETGNNTAIYISEDIFTKINFLPPGVYVTRVQNDKGEFLGYDEIIYDGSKQISLLDIQFMTDREKMQLRDALGIDGPKTIAKNGQLQKKSEYPYNSTVDTNDII